MAQPLMEVPVPGASIPLEEQRRREASSPRAWLHQELERLRDQPRQAACRAFEAEARKHGYCLDCWCRSTGWGLWPDQARVTRHRKPENCPVISRRRS